MRAPLADRFAAKWVVGENDCWQWTATKTDGYGMIHFDGRMHYAHRIAWELFVGEIPEGLTIDHLCRNRACVNPDHLEPVTMRENVLRGEGLAAQNARKTHCPSGHSYADYGYVSCGKRECRGCDEDQRRKRRAA